jgi:GrpB-like predicted nucleotidyltransferase (UPF0157 family)
VSDRVVIVDPDPEWDRKFAEVGASLRGLLGARVLGVEHIGSTAVPGLAAKPIIDVLVGLASMAEVFAAVPELEAAGWEFPDSINKELPARRFGKQAVNGVRANHVHLVVHDAEEWTNLLVFRDALRADPGLAERYEELKRDLAVRFADEREKYTAAKTEFVRGVLARAIKR